MSLKKKKISKNFTTTENKLKTTKKNEIKKCENTAPLFFFFCFAGGNEVWDGR